METPPTLTAFTHDQLLATGDRRALVSRLWAAHELGPVHDLLVFDDETGRALDFDLRGTLQEVLAREAPAAPAAGPGRPKLGVVAREVTLLPRHWAWLEAQPGGASAAIRRLVEAAIKHAPDEQRARQRRDATSRVLTALAGDRPGYEEATRALFAGDRARFEALVAEFPADVCGYVGRIADGAFVNAAAASVG